jgi:hypothetical protein
MYARMSEKMITADKGNETNRTIRGAMTRRSVTLEPDLHGALMKRRAAHPRWRRRVPRGTAGLSVSPHRGMAPLHTPSATALSAVSVSSSSVTRDSRRRPGALPQRRIWCLNEREAKRRPLQQVSVRFARRRRPRENDVRSCRPRFPLPVSSPAPTRQTRSACRLARQALGAPGRLFPVLSAYARPHAGT